MVISTITSFHNYEKILKKDSLSFDGNLGSTNAYFANGEPLKAYKGVLQTLSIFKNQKDAAGFLKKLDASFTPYVEEKLSYTFDNGNNEAYSTNTLVHFPMSTKVNFNATYQYRKTTNSVTKKDAVTNDFNIGMNWGEAAGQTVPYPHVHLIPRRNGDMEDPTGGVRHVIPEKGNYRKW